VFEVVKRYGRLCGFLITPHDLRRYVECWIMVSVWC